MADLTDDQKRLKDFTKKKLQEQGIISSPTEQNNQITPQDNGGFFLPWISNTIPQVNSYEWWIKQGNIQTNIPLPWITNKPETISAIDPHEAIEWMERFRKEESNRVTSQYWTLVKRWFKQIWNTFDKFANANLSKEWILEKLARIGEVNWASKKAMQPYIEENKSQTLAYNKKVNDAFAEWEKRNMDMNILKKYEEETVSWLLSRWDFKWAWYKLIKWLSENATMIPEMVVTMVAPQVWLPLIATDVYIQESQWTFEDLIENWATYEQAENWAVIVWLANASIELILERLLWWVQRAWASTLRRLFLKNMQKEVVRNVTKKWFAEILGKWLLNQVKSSWVEWIEEILQQLVSNSFINTVNPARKLSEGVIESFDQAFWQSFFFPLWWWSESVIKDIQTNNAIDKVTDIEALKYVMDREEAKAQRNRFNEAKERLKNRIINWYTNTQEESEQIAKENEAREQFEQERDEEYKKEMQIENDMINEALLEWDLNEDLWDPRYQKSDSPQSVSEDTVREKSRTWNVSISSENSSEISKNLNEIKKNLEDLKADTFLQQIKKSISWDEKNSNYITNRINGNKYVLRIADHHANAKNSKKSPYNNTSIVVKLVKRKNNGKNIQFKKYKSVDMMEFVYNPENMTTEKMQGIIDWIQNWIKTWEYTDTNYDSKNQSTRKIWEKSDAKYQWGLKYEEDDYIPWIASNKEKSISGKEWIKQRNKINDQTIEELAKKYWVRIDVIKWMIKFLENGKRDGKSFAYGKYVNDVLTLSEQIKESTAPHELLHAIFDMIDPETKAYLISQVMKTEWWSAGRAEERLADSFSNFFRTGKIEWAPKSTWWKIKIFFKRVRSFINWLGKWRNELEDIFTNIITADDIVDLQNRVDENKSLNKSKEAMRKRFMEYRKNAIKIQKKAESENKYQKAWDTESEAFKKRFGDSKVVDENWNPLVVYHGTPYGWFTVFKKTNRWSIWDEWYFGRGWYFTNDKALAKDYSDEAFIDPEERTNEPWAYGNVEIKEVYLKIENPYVVNEKDVEYEMWSLEKLLGTKNPSESTEKLKDEWYDGVIYEFNSGTKEYTVFEPNQIKSATDNIGTYDANNDDIRYQRWYHGSQVEFKKFDHSHMWEWEWHQVHWWWTYIAKDIDTWRYYAEMRDYLYSYDPEKFKKLWREEKSIIDNLIKDLADNWGKLEEYIEWAIKWYEAQMEHENNWYFKNDIQKKIDFLKSLDLKDFTFEGGERHLYEVEYPDPVKADTPTWSNYLEENKVLSRNELDKIIKALEKKKTQWSERAMNNLEDDIEIWKEVTGEDLVHTLSMSMSPRWASKFLESIGYDGIHYFWVRDWEWNVIFNEDNIKIINHEKYQKADIDPEATSPEDLIEVNDKWLDVMVKFVSEKQKKNATDVNKELLTDNGNPYMWTSTNKYKSKVITDWRNVEDSKYKGYTDKWIQVAWFTNNSSMSYSYADYKSKLAPVKKFKSIDELNKFFKENPNNYERILWNWIDDGVLKSSVVYEMKENDGRFELISNSTETLTQSMKDFYDGINNDWFWGNIWEMPENKDEALKKLQEYYNEHDYEIDWERTVKLLKNWNVERTVVKEPTVYKRFDTKLDALAEWYTIAQEADLYHYQWVIQKMKNPLVVDIRSKDNTPSTWSRLWTVNDIFNKEWINYNKEVDYYIRDVEEAMDGFSERMKALEQYWNDAYRDDPYGEVSQFMWNVQLSANNWVAYMVDELEDLLNDPAMWEDLKIGLDTEVYGDLRDYGRTLRDVITELRNFINTNRNYYALKKLSPEWIESWVNDMGAPKEIVKMIKNKNWKDMLGNWRDIGDKWWRENIRELLTTNWMDLETNDWVRYALDSGKYDWVIFKNIIDYGWLPKEWWENAKGGDVAVTFRSNQFKTWDNEDPTDSKYIRYQRVYHWSPADFEKFDSSHMWEWEGAQAHGWGHYVAVEERTWRHYAQIWDFKNRWEYDWNLINFVDDSAKQRAINLFLSQMNYNTSRNMETDPTKVLQYLINDRKYVLDREKKVRSNLIKTNREFGKEVNDITIIDKNIKRYKEDLRELQKLDPSKLKKWENARHLYEVEIPDPVKADTPTWSNYLEEDKYYSKAEVKKFLDLMKNIDSGWLKDTKESRIYDLYKNWLDIRWKDLYDMLAYAKGDKEASKFLESLWYKWIHYYGWRDGEAYVIFNDDDLEITNHEKYQRANSDQKDSDGKTLSNGQAEYFKDSKIRDKDGNLLRVYHGTNSEYTVYDSSLLWASSWDLWFFWDGWYFATHKWEARYYGRNVMEWYLNITNPFYYGNMTKIGNSDFGNNVYVTIRNLWKIDKSINNREIDWYKVSEIWDMVDDYLKNVKLEKLNDAKDPYNGWDITYWRVTEYWKSEIETAMKWLSENGMLDEQLNHYMMDKVWYLKPRDLIEEMTSDARFDKSKKSFSQILQDKWYDGIVVWDNAYQADEIVAFRSNEFKNIDNLNPTDNEDIRYQRVYHWSHAEFDRFDSSHMWEWEWAQAHGWWHYVAVDESTGRHYAESNSDHDKYSYNWEFLGDLQYRLSAEPIRLRNPKDQAVLYVLEKIELDNMKFSDAKWLLERWIKSDMDGYLESYNETKAPIDYENYKARKNILKELKKLKKSDFVENKRRNFYEVEIPDIKKADTPTGSNYLEEGVRNTDPDFREKFIKPEQVDKFVDLLKNYDEVAWQKLADKMYNKSTVAPTMLWADMYKELSRVLGSEKEASKFLNKIWYDGIHYFWWRDGEAYVIFNDDALEIKNHEKYQKVEYEYDENWNRKWIKFWDNSEFDPSIFWENTKEEQIEEDKEKEKSNPFYNAWTKYNDQNYKDDQLTFNEFIQWINEWWDEQQRQYDEKMKELLEAENDPKMLELQLRAVKLLEEEWNVGKKFWKNVSKEVRDRQQAEVEKKREQLAQDIFDWMYPWLKFEDATYKDQESAWDKEAEWEMLGKDKIEEKLKYFRKDNNGDWIAKDIKIESPQEKRDKIEKSWNFSEIFSPVDRVLEWKTPQWQKWILDKAKDPKQFKKVMEKINKGTTKTKVILKDITQEVRALEKTKAEEEAEKERQKKERQEAMAKKKQDEYKRNVRMKAFQRLVDMQRFEKYPFLTEDEIKKRWGFTDEEWKKITEQEDLKFPPKKYGEKAIKDFNKAVDEEVRFIIEWLSWQNTMKRKDAEKNLWEIEDIDLDILLGRDEEKWQKEVDEFKRLAEEKWEDNTKKRLKEAKDNIMDVEIDKERENSKSEKERVDKIIKSTKSDKTVWWSIKEFSSDIITPVSTRIREISPKIHREVMRYFQNKDIKTNQRLKEIDPFLKAMKKIRKENPVRFMDIWVNLANRNIWYANGLLKEYGVTVPTELLDQIYLEADDVGLNINYLWSYYPLSVKAPRKFLEELMKVNKKDIASEIEKKIMEESQKKWWPLEESEITAIINEVIVWWEQGADINIWNAHLKKRNTEIKWTPKMLEYCDDPISTLISYIEWMTQSIERAKFLWKSRSWNVHTLADYVYNEKNGLDPDQQDELMDLLKAVFNDANPSKAIQTWRDIATLTTLWSPSSTLTQLWDLSFSVYENGWKETLKAVWDVFASRKAFDLKDMWVLNRWEEYTNINSQKNLLQKAIHNVFKLTLFSRFDTLWKSTFIQSTWNKRKKRALKWENGDPQLRKDIMKITDDEYMTDKIINDLKNWVFSEDVALVMYMKLWDIQPLTRAQMPKAYLNNPNGRLFYQFKTFGIKQLDYVLQETKKQTKNFKNLSTTDKLLRVVQIANMVFIMTLLGVWADELKDITMRRRSNSLILRWLMWEKIWSEQIWEKMEDNVLKLFGLSRYTIMQMKNDPVDAITSLFTTLPATNIINYPFKDIYKAFKDDGSINWRNPSAYQLIPVIWKYRYWIYWGGQDKQQQALDKEKKTTTSGWSSRSTRTTKSRSTRNTRNSR